MSDRSPAPPPPPSPAGRLRTDGGRIVDAQGRAVRLRGVSWFGLETADHAPHGLWARSMGSMLDQIQSLGFDTIRVPFCNRMLEPGCSARGIDAGLNPDLAGLAPVEILDRLIARAAARGLRVLLDRHRPDDRSQSPLWYTDAYPEARWIADWIALAERYRDQPAVIGADLHNEPHGPATWGTGDARTDWRLAAERAGDAILAVAPDWLIFVQGIERCEGRSCWWGGNLAGARRHPVRLGVPARLVYAPHDYPPSVSPQPWLAGPDFERGLPAWWDAMWGGLARDGLAPVCVGELGTRLETDEDRRWLRSIVDYVAARELGFVFWCWNPNSDDTGGLVEDDWQTVDRRKLALLAPLLSSITAPARR